MVMEEYFTRFPLFPVLMSTSASVQLSLYPILPIAEETEKSYLLLRFHLKLF